MDSKIIVAIIIGVAMVTSVYLYTQDTAYNRCVEAETKLNGSANQEQNKKSAEHFCTTYQSEYQK